MSIVNSENFACSHAEPTMSISCKLNVICGDRSHGGVVNGDNLEPEPLNISWWSQAILKKWQCGPVLSQKNWECDAINGVVGMWESGECVWVWLQWVIVGVCLWPIFQQCHRDDTHRMWMWMWMWRQVSDGEGICWSVRWGCDFRLINWLWHVCASDALIGEMDIT